MNVAEKVTFVLDHAWQLHENLDSLDVRLPSEIVAAVENILANGSAPNRQYLLTIAAGTATNPDSNPASLQLPAGVDRRGQAYGARQSLSAFRNLHGLTLKISQDAGVSNQWREVEITDEWVGRRKKQDRRWAGAFLELVTWLVEVEEDDRRQAAEDLLQFVAVKIVELAVGSALDYPRFRATPRLAMRLVNAFIVAAPDRPDATEAVVAVAAKVFSSVLAESPIVERRDINSPDPIDVVLKTVDGTVNSGIEVTDDFISLGKIEHEVVPAMLRLGLDRATVVSRGIPAAEASAIEAYIARANTHFEQRIDLVTVDEIESWLNFPGTPRGLATDFLWGVGDELDKFSTNGNRRAWFDVLTNYATSIES